MTHEDAVRDLTRIFKAYPSLLSVNKIEVATLPDVPFDAVVLQLLTRNDHVLKNA